MVTGAGRGIGAKCAEVLAEAGAKVMVSDILEKEGNAIVEAICAAGGEAVFQRLDVSNEEEWISTVDTLVKTFGGFDVLVSNAGIEGINLVEDIPVEQWRQVMSVNADGVFLGMKHAIRAMKPGGIAGKGGSIINMASVTANVAFYSAGAYSSAKGAVRMMTKVAAVECGNHKYGIRVNSVHPGVIRTELLEASFVNFAKKGLYPTPEDAEAEYVGMHPIGKLGTTLDVAQTVLYLASDASDFVTGAELIVDGGYIAH